MGSNEFLNEFGDELAHAIQGSAPGQTRGDFILGRKLDRLRREVERGREAAHQEERERRRTAEYQEAVESDRARDEDYQRHTALEEARREADYAADQRANPGKYKSEAKVQDGLRAAAVGRLGDATLFFREAVEHDRSNAMARVELARCLAQESNFTQARPHILAAFQYAGREDEASDRITQRAVETLWSTIDNEVRSIGRDRFIALSTRRPEVVTEAWIRKAAEMGWEDAAKRLADDERKHVARVADRCARLRALADRLDVPATRVPIVMGDLGIPSGSSPAVAHARAKEIEESARKSLEALQQHVDSCRAKLASTGRFERRSAGHMVTAMVLAGLGALMAMSGVMTSAYLLWVVAALCAVAQIVNYAASRVATVPYYGRGMLVFGVAFSLVTVWEVVFTSYSGKGLNFGVVLFFAIAVLLMRGHFQRRRVSIAAAAEHARFKSRWDSAIAPVAAELIRMSAPDQR